MVAWARETFILGVLGPWDCDPIFAQALPSTAAQLAVDRVNRDASLLLGSHLDFKVIPTGCDTPHALATFVAHKNTVAAFVGPVNPGYCPAAALLAQGWGKSLFSWACGAPEGGGELVSTLPSAVHVLLSVMRYFGWARLAIVSSHQDIWLATAQQLATAFRAHGLSIGLVTSLGPGEKKAMEVCKQLHRVRGLKIVVLCMHSALLGGLEQSTLLRRAWEEGLADGRLVFLPYDTLLFALPYRNRSYLALGDRGPLQEAYDAVLTISLEFGPENHAFTAAKMSRGAPPLETEQVSPLFGTIYDAVLLLAYALNRTENHGAGLSGAHLGDHIRTLDVAGFSQRIQMDGKGRRLAQYVILDTDGEGSQLVPTHILDTSTWQVQPLGKAIHFPGGSPPVRDASCWFEPNTLCIRGVQPPDSLLTLTLACVLALIGGILAYLTRLGLRQLQLVRGPHRILLTAQDLTFLQMTPSRQRLRGDGGSEPRSVVEGGSPRSVIRGSARSLPAVLEHPNVALYQMREMRHENVTAFLGLFVGPEFCALVLEHCPRGSLEDLLRNEALKLDWTFKASLLLDLIRGVRYLHHRRFPHGRLKSRNCVLDSRFVLKITDHGYEEFLEFHCSLRPQPDPEELLWTAPELLRRSGGPGKASFKGDVFSLGIILQEVLTRGPPYCSWGLSAEVYMEFAAEIIRKVSSPPPLCRPLVSPDQGPRECIQLMQQCWEEDPEDRPSMDQIYTQFKVINQGKKMSVADSMLRMLEKYSQSLEGLVQERTEELELERRKTERLLSQMLPPSVANALKMGRTVEPEYFDQVTIYFSDIVGFTTISALSEPIEVVGFLNDLYTLFDAVLDSHDVYKVETIGDAYMVASGLPRRNGNRHAAEIANMALDILSCAGNFRMRHAPDVPICVRAGLHSAYRIHVSRSTVQTLLNLDEGYTVDVRGQTELKGKGSEETYWLTGKVGFCRPLPTPLPIRPG
ncbi:hypothetical protein U0070_010277 [Myodes glareolus]|uniref:guanylate cyclase n=1 Tax=Myodes glareolus TaxID=447135 RepID=A0AAW0HXE8_MYOGA